MKSIFLKKVFTVVILCFVFLNVLGLFLDFHLRQSNIFKINLLFNTKSHENIVLGASKSLTGINSQLLSEITHKKWYNLSMDDTKSEMHILFLEVLNNLKKDPKNILLQYDRENSYYDTMTFFDNDYQLLPFLNTNIIISNYFKPKPNYLIFKYLPIFKYIYYNTELLFPSLMLYLKPEYTHRFDIKSGDYNYPNDYIMRDSLKVAEHKVIVLKNPIIFKFDSICKVNSIKLFLYTAPMYKVNTKTDIIRKEYFDFSNIYSSSSKFSDGIHIAHHTKNDFTVKLAKIFDAAYNTH